MHWIRLQHIFWRIMIRITFTAMQTLSDHFMNLLQLFPPRMLYILSNVDWCVVIPFPIYDHSVLQIYAMEVMNWHALLPSQNRHTTFPAGIKDPTVSNYDQFSYHWYNDVRPRFHLHYGPSNISVSKRFFQSAAIMISKIMWYDTVNRKNVVRFVSI